MEQGPKFINKKLSGNSIIWSETPSNGLFLTLSVRISTERLRLQVLKASALSEYNLIIIKFKI